MNFGRRHQAKRPPTSLLQMYGRQLQARGSNGQHRSRVTAPPPSGVGALLLRLMPSLRPPAALRRRRTLHPAPAAPLRRAPTQPAASLYRLTAARMNSPNRPLVVATAQCPTAPASLCNGALQLPHTPPKRPQLLPPPQALLQPPSPLPAPPPLSLQAASGSGRRNEHLHPLRLHHTSCRRGSRAAAVFFASWALTASLYSVCARTPDPHRTPHLCRNTSPCSPRTLQFKPFVRSDPRYIVSRCKLKTGAYLGVADLARSLRGRCFNNSPGRGRAPLARRAEALEPIPCSRREPSPG